MQTIHYNYSFINEIKMNLMPQITSVISVWTPPHSEGLHFGEDPNQFPEEMSVFAESYYKFKTKWLMGVKLYGAF